MSGLERLRRDADELEAAAGVTVEITTDGVQAFVVIQAVPLPVGTYRLAAADALFLTDLQYPLSAMDMFWTDLEVLRPDGGVPQNADQIETYAGRQWRRFSWHRNGPWKTAGNPLMDHYEFMLARFEQDRAA